MIEAAETLDSQLKNSEQARSVGEERKEQLLKKIQDNMRINLFAAFEQAPPPKQPWRMTQIFTNDYDYHRAYTLLHQMEEVFDFSTQPDVDKIFHKKLEELYEYWILAKIIEVLVIHQHWETEDGGTDLLEILRRFWELADPDAACSPPIRLRRKMPKRSLGGIPVSDGKTLHLELYYNSKLRESLKDIIQQGVPETDAVKNTKELKPDYLFRIKKEGEPEKIFILDAKYRNYEDQGWGTWLDDDLCGVCAEKYIMRPKEYLGIDVSAAFIVHPDMTPKPRGGSWKNPKLGKYVAFNARTDDNYVIGREKVAILNKGVYPGDKYQVGGFYLAPHVGGDEENFSEENLKTYFEMIFEFFFGGWDVCWHCGSEDVKIEKRYTEAHFPKYHLHCQSPSCNEYWVRTHDYRSKCPCKLTKHKFNYHTEDGNTPWFVFCPHCDIKGESDKKKPVPFLSKVQYQSSASSRLNSQPSVKPLIFQDFKIEVYESQDEKLDF